MTAGAKLFSNKIIKTFLVYGFIWLAAFTFGAYFRFYPLLSYSSSDSYEKASLLVISRLRTAVADKIIAYNPHLSNAEKNKLIKDGLDYIMHSDTRKVITSIDKVAKDIDKKFPAEKSYPYLLEADPYNYYSLTQNIVRTGKISDTIFASKYLNKRMLAPFGHLEPFSLHPYVGLLIYKFCNIFNPNIPLMYAVSFTPIVMTGVALMAFLYVCYLLKYRTTFTFIGALFFMLSPIFIKRSAFGWYDNDPYNILFPFLIIAVFFLGIDRCRELKKSSFFVILNSFLIGLYALFWQGWVYLLAVIFISSVGILVYNHFYLKEKKKTRFLLFYLGGICAGSFLMVSLMFGIDDFFILFAEGWRALKNFLAPQLKPWPDIFIGVGELRKISFKNLTIENGGFVFLVFSLLGFIAYGIKSLISSKHNNDPLKFIFLATFLGFSFFISLGAQRFALLTLIPLSVFFPLGLEEIYQFFKKRISVAASTQHIPLLVLQLGFFVFLGIALGFSVFKAHETMLSWRPIFNETWDKTLTKIRQETPKESIVNSWWPPGHFITSIAERRVTFDGATINNPQAYWLANMFLSSDEVYAVGVLRMLNNSANRAVELLEANHIKLSLAVQNIQNALTQSRSKAKTVYESLVPPEQSEALLNLTHNTPAPSYVLVYNDLMEKNMELSFIGKWNFEAVENIKNNPLALRQIPARNSPAYIKFLWDLAGGPYRNSEILSEVGRRGNTVLFAQDIAINLNNMTCRIHSKIFGSGVPQSIFYAKNNEVIERRLEGADLPFSVLLFKENPSAQCMVVDRELARSLLFRLYFFEGKGLKYFKPFIKEEDLTKRTKIYVYRIDWEGFKRDIER